MPERKHTKTGGFGVCECGEILQYIEKSMRRTVYLQHTSNFAGICSASYTSRKTGTMNSLGSWRFGSESETDSILEVYSRSCVFTVHEVLASRLGSPNEGREGTRACLVLTEVVRKCR